MAGRIGWHLSHTTMQGPGRLSVEEPMQVRESMGRAVQGRIRH